MKDVSKIPLIMNEHFASIGIKLASKLAPPRHSYFHYLSKCESPVSSFLFDTITPQEVKLEILSIPNSKSYGLYSAPTKLLKLSMDIIH